MQKHLLILFFALIPVTFSCNKLIEEKKKDIVVEAMTDGRWYVKEYKAAGLFVTAEFDGYEFQFYEDGKVQAILSTTVTNGTWTGDINALTITSNFAGAQQPVSRMNGVWKITDNSWTQVKAYNVVGADTNFLELLKK
jgi:hypothetical protein